MATNWTDVMKGALASHSVPALIANTALPAAKATANSVGKAMMESDPEENKPQPLPEQKPTPTGAIPTGGNLPDTNLRPQDQAAVQSTELQQKAEVANQDMEKAKAAGYQAPPDAKTDPVGHLAARNTNMSKSIGGTTGEIVEEPPEPPTAQQAQAMQLDQVGKQAAFDMSKIPVWYKSDSFNYGLISFGLNLLSGNDLASSFNQAGQAFGQMYGQEKRQIWAGDLVEQGYAPQDIQAWVESGDPSALKDPMQKKMDLLNYQMNVEKLNEAQYENSPEMRTYRNKRQKWEDQMTVNDFKLRQQDMGLRHQESAMRIQEQREARADREQARREKAQLAASGGVPSAGIYKDTDGTVWDVMVNSRGTPLINTNGMASVRNRDTGEVTWRNISDTQRQQAGIQAQESLAMMNQIEDGGLLDYSGSSVGSKISRGWGELTGGKGSDLSSQLSNINGTARAVLESQLMAENNNRPVQKSQLDSFVKRIGTLDVKNSPQENKRIMDNYRAIFNGTFNSRDETHQRVKNKNYDDAVLDNPSLNRTINKGSPNLPQVGEVRDGYQYIGGNPNDPRSWVKI
ncbi:hypothetical protein PQC38_gp108 [Aeromonas phage BUCT695]|uniref:hypothetical protein n=1 Tax=Aeromonas phage BUCT695 TaxID=2908630 RepID=UPI0023297DEE|nr:hypothetical protein PQC38_gp108 [Aeromonas phage BUCT695]UIW10584.1 hypothetical protein [Aeromonas phage BUCT695]